MIVGWLICAPALGAPVAVEIRPENGGFLVQARSYTAVVAKDGCLTSLRLRGHEFFTSRKGNPRGAYTYQKGPQSLHRLQQTNGGIVTAANDRIAARWKFEPNAIRWEVTNRSDSRALCLIVFDRRVEAVADSLGEFEKTPVRKSCDDTTWYRGAEKLTISGKCRIWGPWADGLQVWESRIGPGETHEVVLKPGTCSPTERRQVDAALEYAMKKPEEPNGPMWNLHALARPPAIRPAEGFRDVGVRAVFFDGPPYKGRPTRVFAWIGVPADVGDRPAPGIVLVHGGGGTAFADWVRLWVQRGYAAIALDTCGCTPGGEHGRRPRHKWGGPPGWGGFAQIDRPREDQWTWHAVADIILAHSLLRSLPETDPDRTGITGISWGGYLTCIAAGVDSRFKFAVPVYGCGFADRTAIGAPLKTMTSEQAQRWMRWWDPSVYLPNVRAPMLWISGTNDFAFTLEALQASYRLPLGPRALSIRLRMPHGQGPGQSPEEIRIFADSVAAAGAPLPRILAAGRSDTEAWVKFASQTRIVRAELLYTCDGGKWQERKWEAVRARLGATGRAVAPLPAKATCWFMNVIDERGAIVSSEHQGN